MLSFTLTLLWIIGLPTFLLWAKWHLPVVPLLKPDRVAFLLAVAAFGVQAIRRPEILRRPGRVEKAMAVYLAVIVVSWWTTAAGKDLSMVKQDGDFLLTCFLMPYAGFLIARNTEWSPARFNACIWLLVGGVGTCLLFFGVMQYAYSWNFLVPAALEQFQPDRAKGPFDNAVPYGMVLSMFVLLTLFLYERSRGRVQRVVLVAIAIGLVQSIVASKTRAAWLALPLSLVLPVIRYPRIRILSAVIVAGLAVQVVLVPALALRRDAIGKSAGPSGGPVPNEPGTHTSPPVAPEPEPESDFRGLKERLVEANPLYDRAAVLRIAVKMIADRPLFGFGFGVSTFERHKADYYAAIGSAARFAEYPNNPHDDVLNVLVLMGVVGGVCYVALLWMLWQSLSNRRAERAAGVDLELAPYVQGVFIVVMVAGAFHSAMHMAYVQVLFYFLAGIVARAPARSHPPRETSAAAAQ